MVKTCTKFLYEGNLFHLSPLERNGPSALMRLEIPSVISKPYPLRLQNEVIAGFSRGSSELGIPTANIHVTEELQSLDVGIYFGFARLATKDDLSPEIKPTFNNRRILFTYGQGLSSADLQVFPMVMSIGYNPFYQNEEKAAEVHIIHEFSGPFYGASIDLVILGYLRPELDYTTKGTLILADVFALYTNHQRH